MVFEPTMTHPSPTTYFLEMDPIPSSISPSNTSIPPLHSNTSLVYSNSTQYSIDINIDIQYTVGTPSFATPCPYINISAMNPALVPTAELHSPSPYTTRIYISHTPIPTVGHTISIVVIDSYSFVSSPHCRDTFFS